MDGWILLNAWVGWAVAVVLFFLLLSTDTLSKQRKEIISRLHDSIHKKTELAYELAKKLKHQQTELDRNDIRIKQLSEDFNRLEMRIKENREKHNDE